MLIGMLWRLKDELLGSSRTSLPMAGVGRGSRHGLNNSGRSQKFVSFSITMSCTAQFAAPAAMSSRYWRQPIKIQS